MTRCTSWQQSILVRQQFGSRGNANDTAGNPASSMTSGQTVAVATLAMVIFTLVNDNGTADDGVSADEAHLRIGDCEVSHSLGVCLAVAQITDVPETAKSQCDDFRLAGLCPWQSPFGLTYRRLWDHHDSFREG